MAARSTGEWKPLLDAAYAGDVVSVKRLLAHGTNVNLVSPNSHRHTPLVRAVEWKKTAPRTHGHYQVAEALLAAGADATATGGVHRWTPLAHALMSDEANLVALLQPHGPDDLAHRAMALDARAVTRALGRKGANVNATDVVGRTALHYLSATGLHRRLGATTVLRVAEQLLDAGADVNAAQTNLVEEGWQATPIWWAVGWQENYALAERLLRAGAAAQPAFFAAAFDGEERMLTLLLEHGARLEHRVEGRTVLMDVMRFKRPRHVAYLLARGADATATDAKGDTVLHFAVRTGVRPDVLAALIAHGADPECANAEGATPRSLARTLGRALPAVAPTAKRKPQRKR